MNENQGKTDSGPKDLSPVPWTAPDGAVDMGTGHDCSDDKAHTGVKSTALAMAAGGDPGAAGLRHRRQGMVAFLPAGSGQRGLRLSGDVTMTRCSPVFIGRAPA